MPTVAVSNYAPPWLLANGHLQTLLPALFRQIRGVTYQRQRIETPDGDFLDLDWAVEGARHLAVIAHGWDEDSQRDDVSGLIQTPVRKA